MAWLSSRLPCAKSRSLRPDWRPGYMPETMLGPGQRECLTGEHTGKRNGPPKRVVSGVLQGGEIRAQAGTGAARQGFIRLDPTISGLTGERLANNSPTR